MTRFGVIVKNLVNGILEIIIANSLKTCIKKFNKIANTFENFIDNTILFLNRFNVIEQPAVNFQFE